jgi:ABC-type multidrug transport system fused ATPase/permease subunit
MRPATSTNNLSAKAERTRVRPSDRAGDNAGKKPKPKLKQALPLIGQLLKPRRNLMIMGFGLMIVNRLSGLVLPMSAKFFVDNILTRHQGSKLLPLIGIVLGATLIQAITSFALTQSLSKAAQRLIADLRKKVQYHISRLPVSFYDANRTGVLVSRIMTDVEGVRNLIGTGLVDFCGGIITAFAVFFVLLRISAQITLIIAAGLIVFTFLLQKVFRTLRPIFRERGKINAEVTGRLTESLGGVRVVKGYHAEGREIGVFAKGIDLILNNVMQSLTITSFLTLTSTSVVGVAGSLVMFLGGRQVLAHHMTTGQYVEYTLLLAFLVAPVFQVVNVGTQLTEAVAGLDRTNEILNEREEYADPRRTISLPSEPGAIRGDIRFDHVSFAYEADKPVLRDLSFDAAPGTVTALVGSSGSGKSTIISLVCAFHVPDKGAILVDGIDLATIELNSFRSLLGVVLQESFLFDGSIRDNVIFSKPHATEEQFLHACKVARVDEFAERFPDQYDTIVGERGVKLSGGQRQRLSIARAILADPRILILDEATSSLDSESEAMIQEGLNYLMRGRTTFVIAHRLSTIRRADQILVVEGGEIIERGNHDQLYQLQGRYRDLYDRQHGLDSNRFLAPGEGDVVLEAAE